MPRPTSKCELLDAMRREFAALMSEIDDIEPAARERAGACESWSVKDLLGHLDAWHEMLLLWEKAGVQGLKLEMPAPGHTWKETPALNEAIYARIKDDPYADVVARLHDSYDRVRGVIETYSEGDLVTKRRFKWTGSTSVLSYAVSNTSSHYDWARQLVRKFKKTL